MNFSLRLDRTILIQEIDPFLAMLLTTPFEKKNLEQAFLSNNFLKNIREKNPDFSNDWREYIEPELVSLFASCHKMVLVDLAQMHEMYPQDASKTKTLTIPPEHREAWLRMLSMIRLELSAQHQLSQDELETQATPLLSNPRGVALLQMQLFAVIQQYLIEAESV